MKKFEKQEIQIRDKRTGKVIEVVVRKPFYYELYQHVRYNYVNHILKFDGEMMPFIEVRNG